MVVLLLHFPISTRGEWNKIKVMNMRMLLRKRRLQSWKKQSLYAVERKRVLKSGLKISSLIPSLFDSWMFRKGMFVNPGTAKNPV